MWDGSLGGYSGPAGSACKGLKCPTEDVTLCQKSNGEPFRGFNQESDAITCAFQKEPSGCQLEDKLQGVRLES